MPYRESRPPDRSCGPGWIARPEADEARGPSHGGAVDGRRPERSGDETPRRGCRRARGTGSDRAGHRGPPDRSPGRCHEQSRRRHRCAPTAMPAPGRFRRGRARRRPDPTTARAPQRSAATAGRTLPRRGAREPGGTRAGRSNGRPQPFSRRDRSGRSVDEAIPRPTDARPRQIATAVPSTEPRRSRSRRGASSRSLAGPRRTGRLRGGATSADRRDPARSSSGRSRRRPRPVPARSPIDGRVAAPAALLRPARPPLAGCFRRRRQPASRAARIASMPSSGSTARTRSAAGRPSGSVTMFRQSYIP